MIRLKEVLFSPIWFIPVALMVILASIEAMHLAKHEKYCKTEAQWMNERGVTYDRESAVE